MICTECGKDDDCRPYGKNAAMVCFDCGMKDEAEAKRQFAAQFLAATCVSDTVVIGEETGPRPLRENT